MHHDTKKGSRIPRGTEIPVMSRKRGAGNGAGTIQTVGRQVFPIARLP
jgi:hypothetical protein